MHAALSEEEQGHIYSALLVANNEWQKVKKSLAKLNSDDPKIDEQIALNAQLRKQFNPRAEEEARESERRRTDPAQLSIIDQPMSSGETGGGIPAGQVVKLRLFGEEPKAATDPELRDALMEQDFLVLVSDIRGWTSSDRDRVVQFLNDYIVWQSAEEEYAQPEVPEILEIAAITQDRMDALNRMGPYTLVELFDGKSRDELTEETEAEPTSVRVVAIGADEGGDKVDREYVDPIEAEIRCARLNRDFIKNADLPRELAEKWMAAGPWSIMCESHKPATEDSTLQELVTPTHWYVVLVGEDMKELAASDEDALLTAARYNRAIAGRDEDGNWREPPVRIDSDAAQEIRAAAEAGDEEEDLGGEGNL